MHVNTGVCSLDNQFFENTPYKNVSTEVTLLLGYNDFPFSHYKCNMKCSVCDIALHIILCMGQNNDKTVIVRVNIKFIR